MKLARIGVGGQEAPVAIDPKGILRDLTEITSDIDAAFLEAGGLAKLAAIDLGTLPEAAAGRYGPCVANPGKIICVGLNYVDHAKEAGFQVPPEPITFLKATSSLTGPDDPILRPRRANKLDWEIELGVVIGKRAQYVSQSEALSHVAGYCIVNDVSERSFQLERAGQWSKGKSFDSFAPTGPWLVTADEIPDPQRLGLRLEVNGEVRQQGSTRDMIFGVAFLLSYISEFMTLHPGDIIATGTPPGVGMGMEPPVYLADGDVVDLEIEGLGRQRQAVISPFDQNRSV